MFPAISQICTLNSSFEDDIADYAAAKCEHVEIWLTKLESYLKDHSLDDVRRIRDENHVSFPAASFQGGLFELEEQKRALAWQLFLDRLELCKQLEIPTLVVAADIAGALSQEMLDGLVPRLTEIASEAGRRGLKVALEFQSKSLFINNLETASALVRDVGSPHLGVCLDVFQFMVGPSKLSDLRFLDKSSLFHVQISDLADTARELASDADRILPGDGDFDLPPIIEWLASISYENAVSLELMNGQIWQIPALQVGEIGITALRKCMKTAEN